MAFRKYQGKSFDTSGEFIHIDLLPDVKRPRQFNVNILLIVLIAVIASWLIIYWPLSGRQEHLDEILETQSDLQYSLLLVNEELFGYRIEPTRIAYAGYIENAEAVQHDFTAYMNVLQPVIEQEGTISKVTYDAVTMTFEIRVVTTNVVDYILINDMLLDIEFVDTLSNTTPTAAGAGRFTATFTIGVSGDAE